LASPNAVSPNCETSQALDPYNGMVMDAESGQVKPDAPPLEPYGREHGLKPH
jgi:hypothetical protein